MIEVSAIKKIPVDENWIIKGAKYAEKSWPYTYNRMGKSNIYQRLRNIVKGIIAQESLSVLLRDLKVPYEIKPAEKWYDVDRFDYLVPTNNGKILLDIKSFFIPKDNPLLKKEGDSYFLGCSALVPKDQMEGREMSDNDIYVFAFVVGREPKSLYKSTSPIQNKWLIHCMLEYEFFKPPEYLNKSRYTNLGVIELSTSPKDTNREFVLGGTIKEKEFYLEKVKIETTGKAKTKKSFFQLFFIRSLDNKLPNDEIKVTALEEKKTAIIPRMYGFAGKNRNGWEDIWIYDAEVYFVGFSTKGYFRDHSETIQKFSNTVKQWKPKTDNYRMVVKDLPHPISELKEFLK